MTSPSLVPDKPCPICGKPAVHRYRPFCSRRCGDIDLNRWLTGAYAIPVTETDDDPERPRPQDPEADQG
jgi:endogenous inhibitor of DNA gyrase (YacG/DUF329 family)